MYRRNLFSYRLIFIFVIFLLLGANSVSGDENKSSKGQKALVKEGLSIISEEITLHLKEGIVLTVYPLNDETVFFNVGSEKVEVPVQSLSFLEETTDSDINENIEMIGTVYPEFQHMITLFSDKELKEAIGYIEKIQQLPVYSVDGDVYETLIGNKSVFFSSQQIVFEVSPKPSNELDDTEALEEEIVFLEGDREFRTFNDNNVYASPSKNSRIIGKLKKNNEYKRIGQELNFHIVNVAGITGYVEIANTHPSQSIPSKVYDKNSIKRVVAKSSLSVYDNSTGSLVEIGVINQGETINVIEEKGNWYEVVFLGKKGYVYKPATEEFDNKIASISSNYFKVVSPILSVYINKNGELIKVGALTQNQVFPSEGDYGNWIKIKYGDSYGFIWKDATLPVNKVNIKNLNHNSSVSKIKIVSSKYLSVYDNSSGELVQFASIQPDTPYPIIEVVGNWYKVDVAGRMGYVYRPATSIIFDKEDKYFKVLDGPLTVYDNSSGSLVKVGVLEKGQTFERISDYGNWHKIKYGNSYGFVWKNATIPSKSTKINNKNMNLTNSKREITSSAYLSVYDNSSGSLVKFAQIHPNVQYPIISTSGNWHKVDFAGRIGYVYKPATSLVFNESDQYFLVSTDDVPVYDNRSGEWKKIATLEKGQVYKRIKQSGNWHVIQFSNYYGYVDVSSTEVAENLTGANLAIDKNYGSNFVSKVSLSVYDNATGKLVKFATIEPNVSYQVVNITGNWVQINFSGRLGYVYKPAVQIGPIIQYSNYDISLDEMLKIQMNKDPQTDLYRNLDAYVHSGYITLNSMNMNEGYVNASVLRVRENPSDAKDVWIYGKLMFGDKVKILSKVGDWYKIEYGTWRNAKPIDTLRYLDPRNISTVSTDFYQFLSLSQPADTSASELNSKVLGGKGILEGMGEAFVQAANMYNINEVYLISHALLETGNGTSQLSNGIVVESIDE